MGIGRILFYGRGTGMSIHLLSMNGPVADSDKLRSIFFWGTSVCVNTYFNCVATYIQYVVSVADFDMLRNILFRDTSV